MSGFIWVACALAFGLVLVPISFELSKRSGHAFELPDAISLAGALWSAWLVGLMEMLSLAHALDRGVLAGAWVASLVLAVLVARRLGLRWRRFEMPPSLATAPDARGYQLPRGVLFVFAGALVFFALSTAIVALVYPPNNADSLGYHMSRVAHWLQNRSVGHFASHWFTENQYGPFAEYVILNFQVLTHSDRLSNMPQWGAYVLCAVNAYSIAGKLGHGRDTQLVAALLAATLPAAVLQASSNQNDLMVACWSVSLVNFGLQLVRVPDDLFAALGFGLSLGLAILTKATSALFVVAFCLWVAFALLRARKRLARAVLVAGAVALAVVAGYFARNVQTYRAPFGPSRYFVVEDKSVPALTSVAIRNVASQAAFGTEGSKVQRVSNGFLSALRKAHDITGRSLEDPKLTLTPQHDAFATEQSYMDDVSGNPVHLLLMWVSFLSLFRPRSAPMLRWYALCLIVGLAASSVLKWQVWGARLVLAMMVIACPLIAATLFKAPRKPFAAVILVALSLYSAQWVRYNSRRPLTVDALKGAWSPDGSEYYRNYRDYRSMAEQLNAQGCRKVGLQ
ncbi:MAG: glycosyltransferase family 39 protein, partial [Archangium sp.]